jgi:uncharacterized membrane protein
MTMDDLSKGVPSTAAIGGHPIHPMLVPFPIGALVGALATDLVFRSTGNPFWAAGSMWLIGAGLVTGALAAVAGLTDFFTIARARSGTTGWVHFIGNALALVLALVNLLLRTGDPVAGANTTGLILSIVIVGILLVTGWLGGELAYRHKIGVIDAPSTGPESRPAYHARDERHHPTT